MMRMTAFENLPLLRALLVIVDCGNISAGARYLRVSQPSLSRQLQSLERLCGTALLRRDTHRMSLTDAGRRVLAEARTLLAQAEAAERRLHQDHTTLSGHLRLFATLDLGQFMVTRWVSQFLMAHPGITATLALNNRPLHMIQEGCDVGVLPGKITDESVIARRAGSIRLQLAAAPSLVRRHSTPRKPSDLSSWPWISLSGSQFWNSRQLTLFGPNSSEETIPLAPVLISEGVTSVREAAKTGLGVALLPDWLIKDEIKSGELVPVLPTWQPKELPIHVVYAGERVLPARVSAFIDFMVQRLTQQASPVNAASIPHPSASRTSRSSPPKSGSGVARKSSQRGR